MLYLLKPKYNQVYECKTDSQKDDVINQEGGVFVVYDHYPTEEERHDAVIEYFL
jgi:hypothetical protein